MFLSCMTIGKTSAVIVELICEVLNMVIHDYLTTISCDKCSTEFQIERNLKESTMRRIAAKHGWKTINNSDYCPKCAESIKLPPNFTTN